MAACVRHLHLSGKALMLEVSFMGHEIGCVRDRDNGRLQARIRYVISSLLSTSPLSKPVRFGLVGSIVPLTLNPLINPLQTPQTTHTIPQTAQTPLHPLNLHTIPPTPHTVTALPPLPIHHPGENLRLRAQMPRRRPEVVHSRDSAGCAGMLARLDGRVRLGYCGGGLLGDCLGGDGGFEDWALGGLGWWVVGGEGGRGEGHAAASAADGVGVWWRFAALGW